jgi:hypothetical protein
MLPQLKWPKSRAITATNAGEDAVQQEHLYTVDGNTN